MPRMYKLGKRAAHQDETRRRIVEATVHLHETRGAANTSISAIADLAGVERLTVYRHFPDERSLFKACTSHYLNLNPPPDPAPWCDVTDAGERLRWGLKEIYSYHRRTEPMFARAAQDLEENPVLREVLGHFFSHWDRTREVLASPWESAGSSNLQIQALIGHAMSFQTWQSLVRRQGLDDFQAVELMVRAVRCIASKRMQKEGVEFAKEGLPNDSGGGDRHA